MNEKLTMPNPLAKLEQEIQGLKRIIETLRWDLEASRAICRQKTERIDRLIKLGLETSQYGQTRYREMWEQEEEL